VSDSIARTGLTLVGQAAGAALGGPFGAAIGSAIGNAAGWWLFPEEIVSQGPRLSELSVQSSTLGLTIPVVYGSWRLAGNIIWSTDLIETRTERDAGGKGGPSQTAVEYSYRASFAVGLCEGPISGVLRIWADSRLVYDVSETADAEAITGSIRVGESMTVYVGSNTQLPDPAIETVLGVGNVPAYRGLAYAVFRDLELAEFGNRIPNLTFEVVESGGIAPGFRVLATDFNSPIARASPRTVICGFSGGLIRIAEQPGVLGDPISAPVWLYDSDGNYIGSSGRTSADIYLPSFNQQLDYGVWRLGETSTLNWNQNNPGARPTLYLFDLETKEVSDLIIGTPLISKTIVAVIACVDCAHYLVLTAPSIQPATEFFLFRYNGVSLDLVRSGTTSFVDGEDGNSFGVSPVTQRSGRSEVAMMESDLEHIWCTPPAIGQSSGVGVYKIGKDNVLRRHMTFYSSEPPNRPSLPGSFVANYISIYADRGLCCITGDTSSSFPPSRRHIYIYSRLSGGPATTRTVGSVVSSLAQKAGLTAGQLDTATLTDPVVGYGLSQSQTARSAIEALSRVYPFFGVESDAKLRFSQRNGSTVATITADDLGASATDDTVDLVESSRSQETDLPARLTLRYRSTGADYQVSAQSASRMTTGSQQVIELDIPVALTDQRAADAAQILLTEAWVARNQRKFSTTRKWSHLEPGDIVSLVTPAANFGVRIVRKSESGPLVNFEAVDHSGVVYSATATPGLTPPGVGITLPAMTHLEVMNLPALRADDDDRGVYAAVFALGGSRWNGAAIERRPINGTTWDYQLSIYISGTLGRTVTALPNWSGPNVWDMNSQVDVELLSGTLSSVTDVAVLNGANVACIGDEVVQFRDATLISGTTYRLKGLLRARLATNDVATAHVASERFVLLTPQAVRRIQVDAIDERGQWTYVASTLGGRRDISYYQTVRHEGRALRPLSPVLLSAVRGVNNVYVIRWTRRARINAAWEDGSDVPLDEEKEVYDVEVTTTSGDIRIFYLSDFGQRSWEIPIETQIATTNFPWQTVRLKVWQKSNRYGRGEIADAVISAPLLPFTRNWDDSSLAGHTLFGNGPPTHSINGLRYSLNAGSFGRGWSRLDTALSAANFALEVDCTNQTGAGWQGVIYRTNAWSSSFGSYAYAAMFLPDTGGIFLTLKIGVNNISGGTENDLASIVITGPTVGTFRMRIEVSGTLHRVFINGIQRISVTDATFTGAGQFALYSTGSTSVFFDNLRIDY
jgi:hypothetical protein